jgi:aminoglycoside phosphotransferase (APT) family kinase protein
MSEELRVDVDEALVTRLLRAQLPQWAGLPLRRLHASGVDNAIFRLGDTMNVRIPRSEWSAEHVRKEQRWLPGHATRLPLDVPAPAGEGVPGEGFPWQWSVYHWLPGRDAVESPLTDDAAAAGQLAEFIAALQSIPAADGPPSGAHSGDRGLPLPARDPFVRKSIANLRGKFDTEGATELWESVLAVRPWRHDPVWLHGDLHPGNLLVQNGRISAVIDWGLMSVGDPALDIMAAWTVLSPLGRALLREKLAVDDDTWARARGWALCVGVIATAYYGDSNPVLAGFSRRAAEEAIADFRKTEA